MYLTNRNDAFLVVSGPADLSILEANATAIRLTRREQGELRSHNLVDVLVARNDDTSHGRQHADVLGQLIDGCRNTSFFHSREDFALIQSSGARLPVNVTVSRLHTATEVLALIVIRDISERVQIEELLKKTNSELSRALSDLSGSQRLLLMQERTRTIGQIANGVAHEINNLLTPACSTAELLLADSTISHATKDRIRNMRTSILDVARVVSQLQSFQNSDDGCQETCSLAEVIEPLRDVAQARIRSIDTNFSPELRVRVDVDDVPDVLINASELRQILINIIFNAVDAMPEGGLLTISAKLKNDSVCLEVTDTGQGRLRAGSTVFRTAVHDKKQWIRAGAEHLSRDPEPVWR